MAHAESKAKGVWCNEGDDVEQSLEVLDKVLLEFEEPDSLPPIVEPDSPSQGNQSEDDGYMSMNGKRTKFSPGFQPTDEVDTSELNAAAITNVLGDKSSPVLIPLANIINEIDLNVPTKWTEAPENLRQEDKFHQNNPNDSVLLQTTLPKARTAAPSKYASLPCPNQNVIGIKKQNSEGSQFAFPHRNSAGCTVLGIGISAVHDAVLRGIAPLPEPIVNEHPVTIYPGRSSPSPPSGLGTSALLRRPVPPRTLTDSIERHREVCRKNPALPQLSQPLSDTLEFIIIPSTTSVPPMVRHHGGDPKTSESEENFSDDSLEEGVSLPPAPPPAPFAPPPPSLSCPATPQANKNAQKRTSVAWEIHLGDSMDGKHLKKSSIHSNIITTAKVFSRRRVRSVSDSHSSLASTPSNSYVHEDIIRDALGCEWPEPPVCSTEDEAASLYSDLDDVPYNPPPPPLNSSGGTYVIRKGRKERQRLSEINAFRINNDDVVSANQLRHSIDLGVADTASQMQNKNLVVVNTPRTRLSLDLNSPTSDLLLMLPSAQHQHIHLENNNNRYNYQPSNHPSSSLPIHSKSNKGKYKAFGSGSFELESEELRSSSEEHESDEKRDDNRMLPLVRVSSLPTIPPPINGTSCDVISTPRRDLAPPPPIEEDEEPESDSNRGGPPPLRQIESNISALLRGDIAVARVGVELQSARRPLGFRPGVHKSESAKEMLLSQQNQFGPLPPSPPATPSSPEPESDGFPPLPPSPKEDDSPPFECARSNHSNVRPMSSRTRLKSEAPAVPPHGRHTMAPQQTTASLKTRSMDAGYGKRNISSGGVHGGYGPPHTDSTSRRRLMSGAFPKRASQSPGEERRLQTSCSLPETPIFARGCDVPRTPHRRAPELPGAGGSRTAPRTNSSLNSSVIGIGAPIVTTRQRSISQALAGTEILRMTGGPARGWYPKQRHPRPASTEHLDHLHGGHGHGSITRAWDLAATGPGGTTGTGGRKTLPPNFTPPKFFGAKSPRDALRRVTSLLIKKGNTNGKEPKPEKTKLDTIPSGGGSPRPSNASTDELSTTSLKKKGFFKSFWKKSKHYSLEH